jgi:cysteine synthase B
MLITDISQVVGNTPLLEVDPDVHGLTNVRLYAKLEHLNPFGSVKDRTAWFLLKNELARLKAELRTVVEATSGNTGKAMQIFCSMHGIPFRVVTNRIRVPEVKQILQLLGAQITEMPGQTSCPDPNDPNNPHSFIEGLISAEPDQYFHPSQYTNERNVAAHYTTTGPEIYADAGAMDFFFGGLGTCGSSLGVGRFLKEKNERLKVIGVIAEKGQVLPGIRNADELLEVGLYHSDFYDNRQVVCQSEAIDAMLRLNRQLGVLAGPTSGAAFAAVLRHLNNIAPALTREHKACFIVCDRVEPYLSFVKQQRPQLFALPAKNQALQSFSEGELELAPEIGVPEALRWLADARTLVVDMRGTIAFKSGHIPDAINVPSPMLAELLENGLPFSLSRRLILVCNTGNESRRIAAYLSAKGIRCASLKRGLGEWIDAGQPLERLAIPAATVSSVVSD